MPSAAAVAVSAGDLVLGKYRIERELGAGGMGAIFAAMHVQLEQRVALKLLDADVKSMPELGERFLREARIAAKLQSEHAARVLDIGVLESGQHCIVMEYLEGEDLGSLLQRTGALPVAEAVRYILTACEALAEAHTHGVVHRDLKPANLFVAQRPDGTRQVKVIDFGIAGFDAQVMVEAPSARPLTNTRALVGTPSFMSPEQLTAPRDVDARSDIWSIGVTLFELVTGVRPFTGATVPGICAAILKDEPKKLAEVRADLPAELGVVIARCLQKDREARFHDLGELANALLRFAPGCERSVECVVALLARAASRDAPPESQRMIAHEPTEAAPSSGAVVINIERSEPRVIVSPPPTPTPSPSPSPAHASPTPTGERERFAILAGLLADMTCVPRVAVERDALTTFSLDPRAGFLLSRIDGIHSIHEILDMAGMETGDALEILCRLVAEGIIALGPQPNG